jgi:hypothetical protein
MTLILYFLSAYNVQIDVTEMNIKEEKMFYTLKSVIHTSKLCILLQ